jgi:RimJ/RimL family protein N-acetyltransferase
MSQPSGWDERGYNVEIRPISRADWVGLQAFHSRLSPATVSLRFHAAKRELTEPLAHRLTDLDGCDEVALVAVAGTDGQIVGVARYSRLDAGTAEVAFVVEDRLQAHHIGSRLMALLREEALRNGITKFVAEVMPGNTPMFHLLSEAGQTTSRYESGECEVVVDLLAPAANPQSTTGNDLAGSVGR